MKAFGVPEEKHPTTQHMSKASAMPRPSAAPPRCRVFK